MKIVIFPASIFERSRTSLMRARGGVFRRADFLQVRGKFLKIEVLGLLNKHFADDGIHRRSEFVIMFARKVLVRFADCGVARVEGLLLCDFRLAGARRTASCSEEDTMSTPMMMTPPTPYTCQMISMVFRHVRHVERGDDVVVPGREGLALVNHFSALLSCAASWTTG